jgi:uncharacterized protein YndB with AHSA1/START domain
VHEVQRSTTATPDQVFAVLANGWLFPTWVVGASRMRGVDDGWPAVGTRLHHSVGVWPAVIDDETEVLHHEAPHRLVLQARGWPLGEATVDLRVEPQGLGSLVKMSEDVTRGPGRLIPSPLRQAAIALRNRETLRRLVWLAEGQLPLVRPVQRSGTN